MQTTQAHPDMTSRMRMISVE